MPPATAEEPPERATASTARHHRYPVLGCPSDCCLNFCRAERAYHRHWDSGRRVARPVEAIVLARDGIGTNGITECRDELLQRSLHAPKLAVLGRRAQRSLCVRGQSALTSDASSL